MFTNKLARTGLINIDAPSFNDASDKPRPTYDAYCQSYTCTTRANKTRGVLLEKGVRSYNKACPHCGERHFIDLFKPSASDY